MHMQATAAVVTEVVCRCSRHHAWHRSSSFISTEGLLQGVVAAMQWEKAVESAAGALARIANNMGADDAVRHVAETEGGIAGLVRGLAFPSCAEDAVGALTKLAEAGQAAIIVQTEGALPGLAGALAMGDSIAFSALILLFSVVHAGRDLAARVYNALRALAEEMK